jgi:hypothetical protein
MSGNNLFLSPSAVFHVEEPSKASIRKDIATLCSPLFFAPVRQNKGITRTQKATALSRIK